MQGFPDDIVYGILVRLPVKELCRFKCVCKSWFSLILSTQFQKDHYHHSKNNPFLFTIRQIGMRDDPYTLHLSIYNINQGTLLTNFSLQVPRPCSEFIQIQSCLGLVCFESKPRNNIFRMFLYNPSTAVLTSLPPTQGFSLCIGFGYAASTNEFKVVRFFLDRHSERKYQCSVFTLGTHDWREARTPYTFGYGMAPFLHGALHFLPSAFSSVKAQVEHVNCLNLTVDDYIAAFDVESEEYKVIPLPECYFAGVDGKLNSRLWLTEIGGSLCLNICGIEECQLELWLLKDYKNGEWVKSYTIHLSSLIVGRYTARALAIRGDGSILLDVFGENGRELVCYDSKENISSHIIEENCFGTMYVESLLSLEVR